MRLSVYHEKVSKVHESTDLEKGGDEDMTGLQIF